MKTYTVEEAQQRLGDLMDMAMRGEAVAIVRDAKRFILQESLFAEPIPVAPPGHFVDCHDEEYIRETNFLTKRSVVSLPPDLLSEQTPRSAAHSVLDIPTASAGAVLRPLASDDDLLDEMLEGRA